VTGKTCKRLNVDIRVVNTGRFLKPVNCEEKDRLAG